MKLNVAYKKEGFFYSFLLILLVFISGLMNSKEYLVFLGLGKLYTAINMLFFILLIVLSTLSLIDIFKKKGHISNTTKYWVILFIAVLVKYAVLFIQHPTMFLPGQIYFSERVLFISNFLLVFILLTNIKSITQIKNLIFALGLGASLSTLIPIIFFPEMIATRITIINNYSFYGSFWNGSVISFITIGWILIASSNLELKKWKKVLLIGIFILFAFGSLAGLSRASLLALITSTFIYLILSKKFSRMLNLAIMLLVLIGVIYIWFPNILDSFSDRLNNGVSIGEEKRTFIWKEYIKNIPDYFLMGEAKGDYRKYSTGGYGPHSVILNWFVQFGIIGLIGFFIVIFGVLSSIRTIWKNQSKQVAIGLLSWLVAYLSVAIINETGFDQATLFISLAIITAWGRQVKLKYRSSNNDLKYFNDSI